MNPNEVPSLIGLKRNQYIEDLEMIGSRSIYRTEYVSISVLKKALSTKIEFDIIYHRFPLLAKIMYYSPVGPAREINRAIGRLRQYSKDSVQRYWTQLRADPGKMPRA